MRRRHVLLGGMLVLAGCAGDGPPRTFAPLRYDYLTPLRLNVSTIDYAPLPPGNALDAQSPVPPGPALLQLAQDRLSVGGSAGTATVTVVEARLVRSGGGLEGALALRVDVAAAGGSTGFAEARVARRTTDTGRDLRGALYDITKQMLDDMNVELEFQVRSSLKDVLQVTETAPLPGAVQQQDLGAPGAKE